MQCELLRRCDESGTLMEIYRMHGGVGATWQQRIEVEARARLAPWLQGDRHIEVFGPCA
jgi:hypothetical protein